MSAPDASDTSTAVHATFASAPGASDDATAVGTRAVAHSTAVAAVATSAFAQPLPSEPNAHPTHPSPSAACATALPATSFATTPGRAALTAAALATALATASAAAHAAGLAPVWSARFERRAAARLQRRDDGGRAARCGEPGQHRPGAHQWLVEGGRGAVSS